MNYNASAQDRLADINAGMRVVKSASSCAVTIDVSLFTVSGGKVLLLGMIGEADGVMQAAATTILIKHVVAGLDTDLSIASASLSGVAADTMLTLPAAVGSALTVSTGEGAAVLSAAPIYVLQPGTLKMTVGGATNTQTITWTFWYVPAEDGAYVTAA